VKAGLFSLFLLWFPGLVTSGMPSAAHLSTLTSYRIVAVQIYETASRKIPEIVWAESTSLIVLVYSIRQSVLSSPSLHWLSVIFLVFYSVRHFEHFPTTFLGYRYRTDHHYGVTP
jgi:hypothetical protein